MPYDIRAACCEHILRTSDSLVKDLTGKYTDIDYGQPYCAACESEFPSELQEAQEAYDELRRWRSYRGVAYADALDRVKKARVRSANYEAYKEEYSRKTQAQRRLDSRTSSRVRFSDDTQNRPELLCRSPEQFDRSSKSYVPGLHADNSGNGFIDTSLYSSEADWESSKPSNKKKAGKSS